MEVVWEPPIIIDKCGLFRLLFISDVDLTDGMGRLTVICCRQLISISREGLYIKV